MTDKPEISLVRGLRPPLGDAAPELVAQARRELMAVINDELAQGSAHDSKRPKRGWRVPLLIAAALGTAAASWVIFTDSSTTTNLGCHVEADTIAIVQAVSGDPIADCTTVWQRVHGMEQVDLVAYDNGRGGIEVVVAGAPVPDDWTQLEPGSAQDPALIELEESLADIATGLESDCYTMGEAAEITNRELERLGLSAWGITEDSRASEESDCSYFYLDPEHQQVFLVPLPEGGTGSESIETLATDINRVLTDQCLALSEATTAVEAVVSELEMGQMTDLQTIVDGNATCTRAHTTVTGAVNVVLRGPDG